MPDGQENPGSQARLAALLAAVSHPSGDPQASREREEAWQELIRLYGRRVYALARSRCRRDDLAEEITQSVFATIATKLTSNYAEEGRFEAWLFRIAMNRIRDEVRRQKRHADPADPGSFGLMPARDEHQGPDDETLAGLRDALDRLPGRDREVIELRHHAGMSFRDIADLLEEPLGTLLARHHRALRKLRQMLEEDQEDLSKRPARPATREP